MSNWNPAFKGQIAHVQGDVSNWKDQISGSAHFVRELAVGVKFLAALQIVSGLITIDPAMILKGVVIYAGSTLVKEGIRSEAEGIVEQKSSRKTNPVRRFAVNLAKCLVNPIR